LPSLVRQKIEETVFRQTQPLEESLVASLVDIVRDCNESISRAYRQRTESVRGTQTLGTMSPDIIGESSSRHSSDFRDRVSAVQSQHDFLDAIADAPAPQWEQFGLSVSEPDSQLLGRPVDELYRDSGYGGTLTNCGCRGTCSCQTVQSAVPAHVEQEDEFLTWTPVFNPEFPDSTNPDYEWLKSAV
jgi:hypothetical protein